MWALSSPPSSTHLSKGFQSTTWNYASLLFVEQFCFWTNNNFFKNTSFSFGFITRVFIPMYCWYTVYLNFPKACRFRLNLVVGFARFFKIIKIIKLYSLNKLLLLPKHETWDVRRVSAHKNSPDIVLNPKARAALFFSFKWPQRLLLVTMCF